MNASTHRMCRKARWSGWPVKLFLLSALCVATAVGQPPEPVGVKTEVDRGDFTARALVLRDGAVMACYERPGHGPVLVLIPETNGDRAQYYTEEFLGALDPSFHLIVVETRGQGRSWPPPSAEQATIETYAADVIEVVSRLDVHSWYVAGHSLGGMTAIEVAGQKPAGLRGIIALEGWVHARASAAAFPNLPAWTEEQRAEARRQREARYRSHRWTEAEYARLTGMWRVWQRGEEILRALELPMLSVWGDRGLAQPPDRQALLLPEKPNIELAWITGAGHHVTAPRHAADTAKAITAFIHRVESRQGARVVEHKIVYEEDGRFGGWPANHGAWSWGEEFLVGFGAAWHQKQDAARHQIDRTKPEESYFARTLDGGESWMIERPATLPTVDVAVTQRRPLTAPLDFTHPDFAMTVRFHKSGPAFFFHSKDRGRTWDGPFDFPDLGTPGILARTDYVVHGPRELTLFLSAKKADGQEGRPLCARTTDGGLTWRLISYIGPEPEGFAIMPSTLELAPGRFFTTVRMKRNDSASWIEAWESSDYGTNWRQLNHPVPVLGAHSGNPPDLLRLRDGRLCLIYGHRPSPRGIRARLSGDEGRTWSEEIVLRSGAPTHDLGYTRSFQRRDGLIVTVYYYHHETHGERYIAATTWDPGQP